MRGIETRLNRLETRRGADIVPALIHEDGTVTHGGRHMSMAEFETDVAPGLRDEAAAAFKRTGRRLIVAIDFRSHAHD